MLKFLFALIIVCSISRYANCQNLILTAGKNNVWLNDLKKANLSEQLALIKSRLLADTNVYAVNRSDRLVLKPKQDDYKKDVECRIQLVVDTGKHLLPVKIKNNTPNYRIVQLCKLLDENNVKAIRVYDREASVSIFGSDGIWGAISLVQKNRSLYKKIRKLME